MPAVDIKADTGPAHLIANFPSERHPVLPRRRRDSLAWKSVSIRQSIGVNRPPNAQASAKPVREPAADGADYIVLVVVEGKIEISVGVDRERRPAKQRVLKVNLADRAREIWCA